MSFGPYYCEGEKVLREEILTLTKSINLTVDSTDPEFKLKPKGSVIDVVSDFVWTASPVKESNDTIPVMYLTELRQAQNSVISSALYYLNTFINSPISKDASQLVDHLTDSVAKSFVGEGLAAADQATGGVTGAAAKKAADLLTGLKKKINELITSGVDSQLLGPYLNSYIGMYITEATGFQYVFPFFEGIPHSVSNSWASSTQLSNPFTSTLQKGMEYIDRAASTFNIQAPGTYIEKPKYFQYPGEGESLTVKLPLLNTLKKNDKVPYQQNYELLWILAYQNKPYRTSFSRILPPKLYNVAIPGIKYMPYAYISKMDVNFLGTRRRLPVNTPGGKAVTSIPEAYEVSITFTSLIADTGNLMVNKGFFNKVDVKVKEK